jgi:hypothetical protein
MIHPVYRRRNDGKRDTGRPTGSSASLSDAAAECPIFLADLPGEYRFSLTVHDGTIASPSDTVTITANGQQCIDAWPRHSWQAWATTPGHGDTQVIDEEEGARTSTAHRANPGLAPARPAEVFS